ncbi:MAG: hypothetical protein WC690_04420 [bacterium]
MSGYAPTAGLFSYSSYLSPDGGLITEPATGEFMGLDFENPPEETAASADVSFNRFETAAEQSATLVAKSDTVPIQQPMTIWMKLAYPTQPFRSVQNMTAEETQERVQKLAAELDSPKIADYPAYVRSLLDPRNLKVIEELESIGPAAKSALHALLHAQSVAYMAASDPDLGLDEGQVEILERLSATIASAVRINIFPEPRDYFDALVELTQHADPLTRLHTQGMLVRAASAPYKSTIQPKGMSHKEWLRLEHRREAMLLFQGNLHDDFARRVIKLLVRALGDEDIGVSTFAGADLQREYFRELAISELSKTVRAGHTDANGETRRIKAMEILGSTIKVLRAELPVGKGRKGRIKATSIGEAMNEAVFALIDAARDPCLQIQEAARQALRTIDPGSSDLGTIALRLGSIKDQGASARHELPALLAHSLEINDVKQRSARTTLTEETLAAMYPDLGERVAALSAVASDKRELVRLGAIQELVYIFRYIFQTDARTKIAAETASWSEGVRQEVAIQVARALIKNMAAGEPDARVLLKDLRSEFRSYTAGNDSLAHVPQMARALLEPLGDKALSDSTVSVMKALGIDRNPALCAEIKAVADRFERSRSQEVKRLYWLIHASARKASKPSAK